jgi:ribonuclease VapC
MVLDASAVVAIVLKQPGFEELTDKIAHSRVVAIGAPTLLECAMVLSSRLKQDARILLAGVLRRMDAQIVPFSEEHFDIALDAFLRFGKARHPAGLNFGDCLAYATAIVAGLPLLFTGVDFTRTDVTPA